MDFKNNVPIYLQVVNDLKRQLITGALSPGAKLPSSRELALQYQINPNTAARIYNELERMGISHTRRGIGTFVTEDAQFIEQLKQELTDSIIKDFDDTLQGMGFSQAEIIQLLHHYYDTRKDVRDVNM